jgi:hypothetical protein
MAITGSENWRLLVDLEFNVTHWPYIQTHANHKCVSSFFSDSWINLVQEGSETLLASSVALLVLFINLTI